MHSFARSHQGKGLGVVTIETALRQRRELKRFAIRSIRSFLRHGLYQNSEKQGKILQTGIIPIIKKHTQQECMEIIGIASDKVMCSFERKGIKTPEPWHDLDKIQKLALVLAKKPGGR